MGVGWGAARAAIATVEVRLELEPAMSAEEERGLIDVLESDEELRTELAAAVHARVGEDYTIGELSVRRGSIVVTFLIVAGAIARYGDVRDGFDRLREDAEAIVSAIAEKRSKRKVKKARGTVRPAPGSE